MLKVKIQGWGANTKIKHSGWHDNYFEILYERIIDFRDRIFHFIRVIHYR
jgi:hypothetical protein